MYKLKLTLELNNLLWVSDWLGHELGYSNVETIGEYCNQIGDDSYGYFIDTSGKQLLEFWKIEED